MPLQHEEHLLDLMGVSGVALPRWHRHDREREVSGGVEILVRLAPSVADPTRLAPPPAVYRRIREGMPVRFTFAEAGDIFLEDGLERHAGDRRIQLVASFRLAHGNTPGCELCVAARCVIVTICSGRTGVVLNSAPNGANASQTAFAIATGGAIAPPSPKPLTPSGLSGEGECRWTRAMSGTSLAVGAR